MLDYPTLVAVIIALAFLTGAFVDKARRSALWASIPLPLGVQAVALYTTAIQLRAEGGYTDNAVILLAAASAPITALVLAAWSILKPHYPLMNHFVRGFALAAVTPVLVTFLVLFKLI